MADPHKMRKEHYASKLYEVVKLRKRLESFASPEVSREGVVLPRSKVEINIDEIQRPCHVGKRRTPGHKLTCSISVVGVDSAQGRIFHNDRGLDEMNGDLVALLQLNSLRET